jgi:soluble lytic murein transglycosylase-like protein
MLSYRYHTLTLAFLAAALPWFLEAAVLETSRLAPILSAPREASSLPGRAPQPKVAKDRWPPLSARELDHHIGAAAIEHGVSHELIRAVIETESRFDPFAISARGACGLMQLMPGTAERFGVRDCFDVRENIRAGTRFLKVLLTRYDGSISLSMAAYNAGEGAVARHGGIPPYRQTQEYVRKVEKLLADLSLVRRTDS